MFLATASTKRPIAMVCLLIALVGLGWNAYRKLSLETLPKIDIPYVTIRTIWVGATPNDLEIDVAKRIEDAVSGLDGLEHVNSFCVENVCNTVLQFKISVDVDVAAVDVREKIDTILDDLPSDCERPVIQKVDINATSVVTLALVGDATIEEKYDYVDDKLGDKFSTLPGVARVDFIGGNEREIHVELDRELLAAAGLTSSDVVNAIDRGDSGLPSGHVRGDGRELSVKFDAEYKTVKDLEELEIANKDGIRLYLSDLATVRVSTEEIREQAYYNGRPAVLLQIVKKAEGNTVKVVEAARKKVEELNPVLPGGMHLEWVMDSGHHVEASVSSTLSDIVSGIILCAIILIIFLGNLKTAMVVCVTMPLTIIISFFFMGLLDYTLNNATLLAIGLSVGILVSNSIVVLENIVKRFTDIPDRWQAAEVGTDEVAVAVLASAGTNVVVMLPIGMMNNVLVGKFFAPFAMTTLIVNLVSIFISFTLTPILCAVFMRPVEQHKKRNLLERAGDWWGSVLQAMADFYGKVMAWLIDRKTISALLILASIFALVVSLRILPSLGFTFFDDNDRGAIFIKLEFPVDYSLEQTSKRVVAIGERLKKFDGLINITTAAGKVDAIGGNSVQGVHLGQIQIKFVDKMYRNWTIFHRMEEIVDLLKDETDCIVTVAVQSEMGGMSTPIELLVMGEELEELDRLGKQVKEIVSNVPGVLACDVSVRDRKPQILVTPRRAVLADNKMAAASLGGVLRSNLEGNEVALFKQGARSFDIRVKYREVPGVDQVPGFMLPGFSTEPIRLDTLADVSERRIPAEILRQDKIRYAKIIGTLVPGAKLQLIVDEINRQVAERNILPSGYTLFWSGQTEDMNESVTAFAEALLLAVFMTYLTLAAILESFTRPFLIMFTLPLGLIGVIWALKLTGLGISVFVLLGTVMLIGVVVNAAVVIIDRMNQEQQKGLGSHEAMKVALKETFRAVLMLILASSLGMLPMALGNGLGSETRVGIGWASFGGVIVSGFLTMTILPLIYTLFTKKPRQ